MAKLNKEEKQTVAKLVVNCIRQVTEHPEWVSERVANQIKNFHRGLIAYYKKGDEDFFAKPEECLSKLPSEMLCGFNEMVEACESHNPMLGMLAGDEHDLSSRPVFLREPELHSKLLRLNLGFATPITGMGYIWHKMSYAFRSVPNTAYTKYCAHVEQSEDSIIIKPAKFLPEFLRMKNENSDLKTQLADLLQRVQQLEARSAPVSEEVHHASSLRLMGDPK